MYYLISSLRPPYVKYCCQPHFTAEKTESRILQLINDGAKSQTQTFWLQSHY